MASHYLQFSAAIDRLTDAERSWLQQQLELVYAFGEVLFSEQELPSDHSIASASWCGLRVFADLSKDPADDDGDAGFEFAFAEDEALGQYLWLFAEEYGNPDHVAHLVRKFLKTFRPTESWSLTYACTCSKPRLDAFGGGTVRVTTDGVESFDAHDFASAPPPPIKSDIVTTCSRRELATLLAALHYWSDEMARQKPAIQKPYFKAIGFPKARPLALDAIAKLSHRLRKELA